MLEGMESMFVGEEGHVNVNMAGVDESGRGRVDGGRGSGSIASWNEQQRAFDVYDDDDLYKEEFPSAAIIQHQQQLQTQQYHHQQSQCLLQHQHQHHRQPSSYQYQPQRHQTEDARLIDLIASLTLYLPPMSQAQTQSQPQCQPRTHTYTQLFSQPQIQSQLLSHQLWNPVWPTPPKPTTPTPTTTTTPTSTATSSDHEEMPYEVYFSTLSLVHRGRRNAFSGQGTMQQTQSAGQACGGGNQVQGVDVAERDARWRLYVQLRMCETGEQDFEVEEKRTLEMMREVLARYA